MLISCRTTGPRLSLLISSHTCAQQISRHRVAVVRALAVNMGWHVNQCSCHVGTGPLEERGHAAGLVVTSPDGARSVYDTLCFCFVVVVIVAVLDILYDYILYSFLASFSPLYYYFSVPAFQELSSVPVPVHLVFAFVLCRVDIDDDDDDDDVVVVVVVAVFRPFVLVYIPMWPFLFSC